MGFTTRGEDARFPWGRVRTTASHTIGVGNLIELLQDLPSGTSTTGYRDAVVEENILGRPTHAGRLRTFRHLRELYLLDPSHPAFRAFRLLWSLDPAAHPLLAGILAFTRDEMLRASWRAIARALPGSSVTSADLSDVVAESYAESLSVATIGKIGRNTGACWTQTGHLAGRVKKTRTQVEARPTTVAFAAYLSYLVGGRALQTLDTAWSPLLDLDLRQEGPLGALRRAHDAGLVDLQVAGPVVEVGFSFIEGSGR